MIEIKNIDELKKYTTNLDYIQNQLSFNGVEKSATFIGKDGNDLMFLKNDGKIVFIPLYAHLPSIA